jgi:hypothetical protein
LVLAILLPASRARADDKAVCLGKFVDAQVARKEGRLRAAEQALEICGRQVCPTAVRDDCVTWLADLRASMPTVVLSATGSDGADFTSAAVTVDGEPLASELAGRSIAVDPGEHVFRFQLSDGTAVDTKLVIRQGERDRAVHVDVPRPANQARGKAMQKKASISATPPPPTPLSAPVPTRVWVLAGTSVAMVGLWAGFGAAGIFGPGGTNDLAACRPHCPSSETNAARIKLAVADVSGSLAVILGGLATFFYVRRPAVQAATSRPLELRIGASSASVRGFLPF